MVDPPEVVVPILRSGILAQQFCERVAFANVEAVFERCLYLHGGGDFVCIGEPDIGNGPLTLIGNLGALPTLNSLVGQVCSISREIITIGNSARFALDQNELWLPVAWPARPSPDCLIAICAALTSRIAILAPQEGLARCVIDGRETSGSSPPLARVARSRIALFERWVSGLLDGRPASDLGCGEAVQGLIGLGPGLTPSGDDFLAAVLAVLDVIGEREGHAAMAHAIVDALPALTTPLSACFLRAAAAGYVGETLHRAVSLIMTGDVDAAITAAGKIGHSSGWDMLAGILTMLRMAVPRRTARQALAAAVAGFN